MRDDVRRDGIAPRYIRDLLLRVGGKNPYGEPMYRVVLAESCTSTVGGLWHDWEDNLSLAERGGMVSTDEGMAPSAHRPQRVVAEMRKVPRYPDMSGWILQRWYPVHMYGVSQQWWEGQRVPGSNVPLLGPYPERGVYEKVSGAGLHQPPALSRLEEAIHKIESGLENQKGTLATRILERTNQLLESAEKIRLQQKQVMKERIREHNFPHRGSSLAAGRLRSRLAERAGLRSHVGN